MKTFILILGLGTLSFFCKTKNEQKDMSKKAPDSGFADCFNEYDMFTLKGIKTSKENDRLEYPYVCIGDTLNEVIIDYKLSNEKSCHLKYLKENNYYVRNKDVAAGKTSVKYYEYIVKDTIFTLVYDLSVKDQLAVVSVFCNNKLKSYALKNDFYEAPSIDLVKKVVKQQTLYSIQEISFKAIGDSVSASISFKNMVYPELSNVQEKKFYLGANTLNWWYIYKYRIDDIQIFSFK